MNHESYQLITKYVRTLLMSTCTSTTTSTVQLCFFVFSTPAPSQLVSCPRMKWIKAVPLVIALFLLKATLESAVPTQCLLRFT